MRISHCILYLLLFISIPCLAQEDLLIKGQIKDDGKALSFVTVISLPDRNITQSDEDGYFKLKSSTVQKELEIRALGYDVLRLELNPESYAESLIIDLSSHRQIMEEVVVTGSASTYTRSEAPVLVDILQSASLKNSQSCSLAEGLSYLPGLRVESNCQTCNYTQLRMNGLGGAYSQILIDGRALISPLSGLYGLEQIPSNMIEQIQVLRGGGSSLYGSSAVGGVVNVITQKAERNELGLDYQFRAIGAASENWINTNAALVSKERRVSSQLNFSSRQRTAYDRNGDGYSELPEIRLLALNSSTDLDLSEKDELNLSLGILKEYRYGGELDVEDPVLAGQAEERDQELLIGSVDYDRAWNSVHESSIYGGIQHTTRQHYTGVFPDDPQEQVEHVQEPPYGDSKNSTFQGGVLHQITLAGNKTDHRFSLGIEYKEDLIVDRIPSYNYLIDQNTRIWSAFAEHDLSFKKMRILLGVRADKHNLLEKPVYSPRVAIKYDLPYNYKLRLNYSTGFRAPQAFDSDLHIAFAGGGVSRVVVDDGLQQERSFSWSGSIEKDFPSEDHIYGFTIDVFHTELRDAFVLSYLSEDENGILLQKTNGNGAKVWGSSIQIRANFNSKVQLNGSLTVQRSLFNEAIEYAEELSPSNRFLRTPDSYGFLTGTFELNPKLDLSAQLLYTGPMLLVHFSGAPEQPETEYTESSSFFEAGLRLNYTFKLRNSTELELNCGVKNLFDAFQDDPDSGKNRDSNYVYGPAYPRTFSIGAAFRMN